MKLSFTGNAALYKSASQMARYWTEQWVQDQVYCVHCGQKNITKYANNRPVADFYCEHCKEEFELKSQKAKFGAKITDGAYRTMCERLASTNNPNFMLLNYNLNVAAVTDLFIVPKHFFVLDAIEKRKPLAPTAQRAGWVGCNILLTRLPEAGKIFLIKNGVPVSKELVLKKCNKQFSFEKRKQKPEVGSLKP